MLKRWVCLLLVALFGVAGWSQSMEWLCHPGIYHDIQYIGNDLFKVKSEQGTNGIISADGKIVLPLEQDSITAFSEERALVLDKHGKRLLHIIDQRGQVVQSFFNTTIYVTAYPYYKEGYLSYKDEEGMCGYLNIQGEVAVKPRFYLAAPFQDGVATVQFADGDGYFGLINKSGGAAMITDTKYRFLSSVVDGYLLAVTSSMRGGDVLRLMKLTGNQLVSVSKLESKMFVDMSDDFSYLTCQNGHHYFIDRQWRITGANYSFELPYTVPDVTSFILEDSELLSKQAVQDGMQITYKGRPILEQSFEQVATFDKKYAIAVGRDKKVGVLRLNPSAGIEIRPMQEVIVFHHNPWPNTVPTGVSEMPNDDRYVRLPVDIKDVDIDRLKCYINDNGLLKFAPLHKRPEGWVLCLPYFHADTQYGREMTEKVDVAITYDGLDWMHKTIELTSRHECGFQVSLEGNGETDVAGHAILQLKVVSLQENPVYATVSVVGVQDIRFLMTSSVVTYPLSVYLQREGEKEVIAFEVTVSESGCPVFVQNVSKTLSYPKKKSEEKKIIIM